LCAWKWGLVGSSQEFIQVATFRAGKPSRLMAVLGPPAFDFCIGASVKRRGKVRACGPLTSPRGLPAPGVDSELNCGEPTKKLQRAAQLPRLKCVPQIAFIPLNWVTRVS
jgi:hypothetical protein